MKVVVPFVYKASIIKPRCRKAIDVYVSDEVVVNIKEYKDENFLLAFKVGEQKIYFADNILFEQVLNEGESVDATIVKQNTESRGKGNKYSCSTELYPFFDFIKDDVIMKNDVKSKDDILSICREWLSDNRDAVIKKIVLLSQDMAIFNGVLYTKTDEPIYEVGTFGLGNNHGGTALFSTRKSFSNTNYKHAFNALQYDEALRYAESVAKNRGDTDDLPMSVNGDIIDVILPEAVKFKINKEDGRC